MTNRLLVIALSLVTFACSGPAPEPAPIDDGTIFTFAPVGPRAFLTEPDAGTLDRGLRGLLDGAGPEEATRAYANRWVQPPGWVAMVAEFGEPTEDDLYVKRGYPFRTNLVDPETGTLVLAYTKEAPPAGVWQARRNVHVSGRLEGYASRAQGVVILLDAGFASAERNEPAAASAVTDTTAGPG